MGSEQSVHRNRTVLSGDESMSLQLRNNYRPLHFHTTHGDNIRLSKNKTVACRSEGFCNGIVFSDRPVMIQEYVYVKFLETSPNWSGALRIGFTMNDPNSMRSRLPRYACPDLTSVHGNWAKAVGEKFAKKDSILHYYVDQNGDVHYGIDAEEYGIFFGGINTSGKLWAVLDIYGNTVAVEFMDTSLITDVHLKERLKFKNFQPLHFHTVHGKNVTLKNNRYIVSKKQGICSFAYAFTERPIEVGKPIVMAIQKIDNYCRELLVYGITTCDPNTIKPHQLPENVYDLFDRSEYWIVQEKSCSFNTGDNITFTLNENGQLNVTISNDLEIAWVTYVDISQPLWLFVNLTYSISELYLRGQAICTSSDREDICQDFSDLKLTDFDVTRNETPGPSGRQPTSECVICYEEKVNCALYRCGHMCMCYVCALKLYDSDSSSQCPICRNKIQDVIKIYK